MSWSLHVMNGLETVFRTFDFAKHVTDELGRAAEGRGLGRFEYSTTAGGEWATLPRWWLLGFTPSDDEIIKDGRGKVSTWRDKLGADPKVKLGLVYLFFWNDRATDRSPVLPPQILVGGGSITFKEWGQSQAFAPSYLWKLGVQLNQHRRQPDFASLGATPTPHLVLGGDFEWRPLVTLESLDTADKIKELANQTAEFVATKVEG